MKIEQTTTIQAGLTHRKDTAHFRFYDSSAVYAAGFVTFDVG